MSSTNKTTNYELSQFVGSDKPAWLTDYNGDMGKIDAGIHTAQSTATGADGKADANATSIGTLANLTTTAKTNLVSAINEVDANADTAQGTADAAGTKAIANETKINNLTSYLAIDTFTSYTYDQFSVSGASLTTASTFTVAKNSNGTLGKLYGVLGVSATTAGSKNIVLNVDTGLRPSSQITISPCGVALAETHGLHSASYIINTDGTLTITVYVDAGTSYVMLFPCLYFMQDFGDEA